MQAQSRPQTPSSCLSGITWQQGPTAFFSQGVPFSYGIGRTLAQRIYDTFRLRNPVALKTPIRALEVGAGLGYLSKHCLDLIHSKDVQWTISDGSSALVRHWQESKTFSKHPQAQLQTLHLEDIFTWPTPLDMVLMSYVLDSTPTCHMEWAQGQLYEWVLQTEISDTQLSHPTRNETPPIGTVSAKDMWKNWDTYPAIDQPWLAPRLSAACHETWQRIPATESPYLDQKDIAFLNDFVTETHTTATLFNYAPLLQHRLPELIAALSPTGFIALHDFGYQESPGAETHEDLCTRFGAIQAYPIHFPMIAWMATKNGAHCRISQAPEGESALCIISKTPLPDTWTQTDSQETQAHTLQAKLNALTPAATAIRDGNTHTDDYAMMAHLAEKSPNTETKQHWLQQAISHYPDMAIPSYGQYAHLLIDSGQIAEAKTCLQDAIQRFPMDPSLALSLANLHIREKEWAKALSLLRQTMPRLDAPLAWHILKMIGLLEQSLPR